MRLTTGILAIVFAAGLARSATADEAFCNAYADESVFDALQAQKLGCKFTGRRWTTDRNVHFNVCMTDWNPDTANGGQAAINEFANRASELAKCKASQTQKSPAFTFSSQEFKGSGDPPTVDVFCRGYAYISQRQGAAGVNQCGFGGALWTSTFDQNLAKCQGFAQPGKTAAETVFRRTTELNDKCTGGSVAKTCEDYATRMAARVDEARGLSCAFLKGGGWNQPRDSWVKECLRWKGDKSIKFNEDGLQRKLDKCKTAGGTAGGGTLTVVKEVTMYDTYKKGNKDLCYLHPGDTLTTELIRGGGPVHTLPQDAAAPWVHVTGTSGECNGKTGYVYNNGKLK